MLPRPRLVCQEPGLRPIGRSPGVPDKSSRQMTSWFWQVNRRACLDMLSNLQAQITCIFYPHAVRTDLRLPWSNKGDKRHKTMAKLGEGFTCCTTSAAQCSSEKWHSPIRNALHNTYTKFGNEISTSRRDGNSELTECTEQDNGSLQLLAVTLTLKCSSQHPCCAGISIRVWQQPECTWWSNTKLKSASKPSPKMLQLKDVLPSRTPPKNSQERVPNCSSTQCMVNVKTRPFPRVSEDQLSTGLSAPITSGLLKISGSCIQVCGQLLTKTQKISCLQLTLGQMDTEKSALSRRKRRYMNWSRLCVAFSRTLHQTTDATVSIWTHGELFRPSVLVSYIHGHWQLLHATGRRVFAWVSPLRIEAWILRRVWQMVSQSVLWPTSWGVHGSACWLGTISVYSVR